MAGVSLLSRDAMGHSTAFSATVRSDGGKRSGRRRAQAAVAHGGAERPWPEIAGELRDLIRGQRIVVHDAATQLAVLAAEGILPERPVIDLAELASVVVPGLAATDLHSLSVALGLAMPLRDDGASVADQVAGVFDGLMQRIAQYDDLTLDRLEIHTFEAGWSFADLFDARVASRVRGNAQSPRLPSPELAYLRERPRLDPLEPTGSIDPLAQRDVLAVIGPDGALAEIIPEFERREQQEQMAAKVAETMNLGGQVMVEAGTGTGKSLAYLVPAALSAIDRGEPVMLSTNTLALQDQLLRKDVPDLVKALETRELPGVNVVAVKGRSNYLCLRRWFPWEQQPSADQDEARLKAKVLAWLPRTETGDRAELRLTGGEEAKWRQIAEDEGACDPGSCIFHQRGQCFLFRARRAAESAHLVVVNHALLLTDATSSNRILPDYDALVIDEAHHLEDQATTQFTVTLSERELTEFADAVAGSDGVTMSGIAAGAMAFLLGAAADDAGQRRARQARETVDAALKAADLIRTAGRELFAALELVHQESGEYSSPADRSRRVTSATRGAPAWQAVDAAWDRLLGGLREAESRLRWFLAAVDEVDELAVADLAEAGERQELLLIDLSNTLRIGVEIAGKYANAFDAPEPDRVYWLERQGPLERLAFRSAPLDVSSLLQERLFKKTRSTILTSATLAVDGQCAFLAERLGIPDAASLIVPSPFDYRNSVLLYLADDMPDPTHPHYRDALEQTLIEAIAATRGRALVLFTSHALLADIARSITAPLQDHGVTVLAQRRDGSPQQLTERLRREENIAVLGTASFWEGVDVAGEALSLLVITRLPFSVPTDPVFAARSEAFDDAFAGYAVPQAVLRFKQGFGRLIRSSRDRGVCAVLDRRILTKRYGATFLQSLPECSVEVGSASELADAARQWLERGVPGEKGSLVATREV